MRVAAKQAGAHSEAPVQVGPLAQPTSGRPSYPEAIPLPAETTALALGQLDDSYEMDLAIAASHQLLIAHGRDRRLSLDDIRQAEVHPAKVDRHTFDFAITALALGDFIADQAHGTEIALLADDGAIHVLEKTGARSQKAGTRSQRSELRSESRSLAGQTAQRRSLAAGHRLGASQRLQSAHR